MIIVEVQSRLYVTLLMLLMEVLHYFSAGRFVLHESSEHAVCIVVCLRLWFSLDDGAESGLFSRIHWKRILVLLVRYGFVTMKSMNLMSTMNQEPDWRDCPRPF